VHGSEATVSPRCKFIIGTRTNHPPSPLKQLGLKEGEAHIIRNAGGMAYDQFTVMPSRTNRCCRRDALRSLIISQRLLGTTEIAVYRHTGCGMMTFNGQSLRQTVKDSDPQNQALSEEVDTIEFLEFSDLEQSVRDDVNFLKQVRWDNFLTCHFH
jgi:carbonic anhydrase